MCVIEEAAASVEDGEIALMRMSDLTTIRRYSLSTTIVEKDNMPVEAECLQVRFHPLPSGLLERGYRACSFDIRGRGPLLEALFAISPELLERSATSLRRPMKKRYPATRHGSSALRAFAETCERPQINLFWH
jgi:hypothetical protein